MTQPDLTDLQRKVIKATDYRNKWHKLDLFFPDENIKVGKSIYHARSHYAKHVEFMSKGRKYKQRCFMAANRLGKTVAAAFEVACHLTGQYPHWWQGKVYDKPTKWWICGKDTSTVRDVLQVLMLGENTLFGSGMIPKKWLDTSSLVNAKKAGTTVDKFMVHHISGGASTVEFKVYEAGRRSFEGTERCIWLDEEPPQDIYTECLLRTMTGDCILMMTFTPLLGYTDTIKTFTGGNYEAGDKGYGRWLSRAGWQDGIAHLTEEDQRNILASTPPHQRLARSQGLPELGAGQVYPVNETESSVGADDGLFIDPIAKIPDSWRRVFSLDFGWRDPTAILWGAINPQTNTLYIYDESYVREQPIATHAAIIMRKATEAGFKIPGVCDPSGGGTSIKDGTHTRDIYEQEYGIDMTGANNAFESGVSKTLDMMLKRQIRISTACTFTRAEWRQYVRNEKGKPTGPDHLMDALRYMVMSGMDCAESKEESDFITNHRPNKYRDNDIVNEDFAAYGW